MKRVVCLAVLLLSLSVFGFSSGVFFRLTGGASYLMGGDYNNVIQGQNDYFKSLSGFTSSGELRKLVVAPFFLGELEYDPVDYVGISLGAGYIHGATGSGQISASRPGNEINEMWLIQLTALFVGPTLHLKIPIGERARVHFAGGVAAYFPSLAFDRNVVETTPSINLYTAFDMDKKTVIGYHAAAGLEVDFTDSVSGFIDLVGRQVSFAGVSGGYTIEGTIAGETVITDGTGTLWYYESQSGGVNYPDLVLAQTRPTDPAYQNVREAKLSLSGVGLQIGLRIGL